MKASKILLGIAFALIVYSGFYFFHDYSYSTFNSTLKGNGIISKEIRNIAVFHGIDAGGTFHINIKQGKPQSLTIEADENIIPVITTKVKKGILYISTKGNISTSHQLNVDIVVEDLDMIDLSGACKLQSAEAFSSNLLDIECSGVSELKLELKCKKLNLDFSGASTGNFSGKTSSLKIKSSGSSKINCFEMSTSIVHVDASGASRIFVVADKAIKIEASGVSNINYKRNGAALDIETSGAASVQAE